MKSWCMQAKNQSQNNMVESTAKKFGTMVRSEVVSGLYDPAQGLNSSPIFSSIESHIEPNWPKNSPNPS